MILAGIDVVSFCIGVIFPFAVLIGISAVCIAVEFVLWKQETMKPKGFTKISISKQTDLKLKDIQKKYQSEIELFATEMNIKKISYNTLIEWICERIRQNKP